MKPWYCKTKGVEPQRAQDLLDLACDNGVNAYECFKGVSTKHPYQFTIDSIKDGWEL